jgi:hypothetical protein
MYAANARKLSTRLKRWCLCICICIIKKYVISIWYMIYTHMDINHLYNLHIYAFMYIQIYICRPFLHIYIWHSSYPYSLNHHTLTPSSYMCRCCQSALPGILAVWHVYIHIYMYMITSNIGVISRPCLAFQLSDMWRTQRGWGGLRPSSG